MQLKLTEFIIANHQFATGHISGIVQLFLYAFIVGVQGAFLFQVSQLAISN